ncbi:hypothetical protein PAMA_003024 [Pampus argenteus]
MGRMIPANPPACAPLVDGGSTGGQREEVPEFNQTSLLFDPFSSNLCSHGSPAVRQPAEGAASLLILSSLTFLPFGIRAVLHPGNHLGTPEGWLTARINPHSSRRVVGPYQLGTGP